MTLPADPVATLFVMTADRALILPFWRDVLGLTVIEDNPYAVTLGGAGVEVQLVTTDAPGISPHPVMGWTVPDIVGLSEALAAKGVRFLHYEGMTEGPLALCAMPDGTRMNWFADPEGHVLMLTQRG